jgi:hypothetical protein
MRARATTIVLFSACAQIGCASAIDPGARDGGRGRVDAARPHLAPDAASNAIDAAFRIDGERYTGVITSFPLPANREAPYSSVNGSKHTNMASDGVRLYVTGGDWLHSATDGTWSMDLADGSWRMDVGAPVHPTLPAPHALQDGAGFVWVASRARFLIWPGAYFPYDDDGAPVLEYARGAWWLDPATSTFTQELGLFGARGEGSGNLFGGIYDEVNDHILVFSDSSSTFAARRWHVGRLEPLPPVPFTVEREGGEAVYFRRGMHVKIGRDVYIIGVRSRGTRESQTPIFLVWSLDALTMRELPPPPVDGSMIRDLEIRMGTSHGKLIWPFTTGPDGEIHGIHIYDPATERWYLDDQVPDYGHFIGNSVTSLPDGRVAFSGSAFGRQQTHIWFYEAP